MAQALQHDPTALIARITASAILDQAVVAWLKINRGATLKPPEKVPLNEKRQFLSQIAKVIKQIKVLAIDWKTSASALVGEAVATWLSRNRDEGK
jgi:hypothetical protein